MVKAKLQHNALAAKQLNSAAAVNGKLFLHRNPIQWINTPHMRIATCVCLTVLAWLGSSLMLLSAEMLKAGDSAPDFSLPGSDGKMYKLSDFKGKQPVVLAWFPKAFTGG